MLYFKIWKSREIRRNIFFIVEKLTRDIHLVQGDSLEKASLNFVQFYGNYMLSYHESTLTMLNLYTQKYNPQYQSIMKLYTSQKIAYKLTKPSPTSLNLTHVCIQTCALVKTH